MKKRFNVDYIYIGISILFVSLMFFSWIRSDGTVPSYTEGEFVHFTNWFSMFYLITSTKVVAFITVFYFSLALNILLLCFSIFDIIRPSSKYGKYLPYYVALTHVVFYTTLIFSLCSLPCY